METEKRKREIVRLRYIRMINCQSWQDAHITLVDGINAIRSDNNNVGKSVVMKLLRIATCPNALPKSERESLIRVGAEHAEVHYGFSDGSAGIVRVFKQRVIYLYTDDINSGDFVQTEGKPHPKLVDNLGIIVDYDRGFLANFIDSEQPMLLVDSDPKLNYNLAKVLTEHETLKRLSENFREKIPEYKRQLTIIEGKVDRLTTNKEGLSYVDVDRMSRKLERQEMLLDTFMQIIELVEIAEEVEHDLEDSKIINFDALKTLGDFLIENEEFINMDINELDSKPVDEALITLGTFLENNLDLLDTDMDELEEKDIDSGLINIGEKLVELNDIVDNGDFEGFEGTKKIEDLLSINKFMVELDEIFQNSISCFNLMVEMEKIQKTIDELNSISFEGEIFDCPVHGKIQYLNGKCEVR